MDDPRGNFTLFCGVDNNIVMVVSNVNMGVKDESFVKPKRNQGSMNSITNIAVLYGELIMS